MVNKVGSEKYYIIISLILGLMVLSLGLFFIFNEFFTEGEIDWQRCRQSILLRAASPDLKELGTDLKGVLPLKCKTEVVTIDSVEPEEVYGKISEAVASGWYMFGEGKLDFVHRDILANEVYCMVFARIRFNSESIEKFNEELASSSNPDADKKKFTEGFYDYYLSTKVPGGSRIYNDYLPMLGSGKSSPRFIWNSEVYPQEGNIALVYVMNKYGTASRVLNYVPFVWVISVLFTGNTPIELMDKLEKVNFIDMVPISDLDEIGCTKFLTIPA